MVKILEIIKSLNDKNEELKEEAKETPKSINEGLNSSEINPDFQNLEDFTFTDTLHTLSQSFNAYRKYRMDYRKNAYKMHFVKDFYPIDKDANIYLWQNTRDLVRVNLNDISDIEQIEFGGLSTYPNVLTIVSDFLQVRE